MIEAQVDSFATARQDDFQVAQERYQKIVTWLQEPQVHTLDVDKKIKLDFPVCGGYSDSCRFPAEYLCLSFVKQDLLEGENPFSGKNFVPYIHTDYYRIFNRIQEGNYIAHQYAHTPFLSTLKEMRQDFYDVQMVWDPRWILVMDILSFQAPINEYGGGNMEGFWHLFDFKQGKYQGSIPIQAQNTPGFMPPTSREKTVEKTQTQEQYLPNGRRITNRTLVQEKQTEPLSSGDQYYYAQQNLLKNFKMATRKAFEDYFTNEKGETLYIF